MGMLRDMARHPLATFAVHRQPRQDVSTTASGAQPRPADRYERQRSERLRELEEAGKCLARSGKDANLRYWPAERGSRVLQEHRRRQRLPSSAPHLS